VSSAGIPDHIDARYKWREWRNAISVLEGAYPEEWDDIRTVLTDFRLCKSHLAVGGGNKSKIAVALDKHFTDLGWDETGFETRVGVTQVPRSGDPVLDQYESPTHKVDSYKNHVGVEVEWNNKDTFFDRDLNNFRLLFELRTIDVGIIITRDDPIKELAVGLGRDPTTYGANTTHWSSLLPRLEGGGGGGCPILAFAITEACYDPTC
jgi:hypothetical protein